MADPHRSDTPSAWVVRWAPLVAAGGRVLDLACGYGRNARYLAGCGLTVAAVDRDAAALAGLAGIPGIETTVADLEAAPWPYVPGSFDAVVVVNYLHRPLFPHLLDALRPGGVLVYETFMRGNERYGRPSNPDFLLGPGELLERVAGVLTPVAFEQGAIGDPRSAVVQRLCAARAAPDAVFLA